jgi:phosphoribosylglycinamide formyltransferase-1
MRLLGASFVERFRNRILNIHPSLLPAFPGVDAQAQALAYGVKVSGCTVHFVDEHLDAGPIIVQRTVELRDGDTADSLSARILEQEHQAYVEALKKLTRRHRVDGRRVVFED